MASLEEKLELLDQEIRTLHKFCVDKEFNPYQIEKNAKCLIDQVKGYQRKRYIKLALQLLLVAAVFAGIYCYDPAYKMVRITSRLTSLKLLKYYDWTTLHDVTCLLENPYFIGLQLVEDDCELCENLGPSIPMLSGVSQTVVAQNYLKQDRPFVVSDGMKNWEAMDKLNVRFLHQLYESEDILRKVAPCMFKTNIRVSLDSPRVILKKAVSGEVENYYAHWENCERQSAKVFRQFYARPYFVPPMVEMAESNWLFVASRYSSTQFKPVDIALPMMWIGMVRGEMKVALTPRSPCKKICPQIYVHLRKGEILVATDLMWMIDYIPLADTEMIAIGGGGYFD